jgi:outer membrane protein TolC
MVRLTGRISSLAVLCALLFAGCTAGHYRRHADKTAYRIVSQVEEQVLGQTNAFTIETPYSSRKPSEILPAELIEDRIRTNQRVLTIDQAIELAMNSSREYQAAKESLFSAALNLSSARYAIGGRITPSSVTTAGWVRDSSGQESKDVTTETGLTISRLFQTGGRLTVDLLNSVMLYYSGKPELSFSRVSGSLVQPLLREFGRNNPEVEALLQQERDMVYAVRDFSFFQDEFAFRIANDYFRLLQQKDNIRNRYTNYLSRVEATKRLEARAVDREPLSGVDQARQAELSARNNYVDVVASYQSSLDGFKITLGLPLSEKLYLDDRALDEVEQTGLVAAALDPEAGYRLAVEKQLRALNFIDQFEDSKRRVRIAADRLKPGLLMRANATLDSELPTDYTRFNANEVAADVSLQLDLPLDRLPRANAYRLALIRFELDLRTFTRRLDDLKDNIDTGLRMLEQRRLNYENQQNALMLANRRVESTTLLLEAGRAEVRDLIEAQDAQISAQNAVTAALVDHQQARLQLMLDIGALRTEQPRFWLKDHLAVVLPGRPPAAATPTTEQAVVPPDQLFNN